MENLVKNDLLLFKVIQEWADYTLLLLEKLPRKYNFTLKDNIFRLVLEVIQTADEANQIRVASKAEKTQRTALQNQLLAKLTSIDRMMQLAVRQKAVAPKQIVGWGKHALKVRNLTLAWIKSDHQRFGSYIEPAGQWTSEAQVAAGVGVAPKVPPASRLRPPRSEIKPGISRAKVAAAR